MALSKKQQHELDEVVVPVISFLTIALGILGIIGSYFNFYVNPIAFFSFLLSIIAIPAGILLMQYRHLGWLLTLTVIGASELLILASHLVTNGGLDPLFFTIFTIYYCIQAYYLIVRRDLFSYPTFHPRYGKW